MISRQALQNAHPLIQMAAVYAFMGAPQRVSINGSAHSKKTSAMSSDKQHANILVITNGKAVIVPADKWPEEPYGIDVCGKFEKQCTRIPEECECFVFNRQKLEAIAQGAVVEFDDRDETNDTWCALREIAELNFRSSSKNYFKDGAYPIDPAKYKVTINNGVAVITPF